MLIMRRTLLLALAAALTVQIPQLALAQPAPMQAASSASSALTAGDRWQAVQTLAGLLEQQYVIPKTGRLYAARLRSRLAAGAYDDSTDRIAFAARLTADLQAVAPDAHLRVRAGNPPTPSSAVAQPGSAAGNDGLEEARMIGPVAYLRFSVLPQDPKGGAAARAFLVAHADAKAVIIDARGLRGGGQPVMDALFPLFYAQPTTLVRMDTRAAAMEGEGFEWGPTLVRRPAPRGIIRQDHRVTPDRDVRRLQTTPVYYLTSSRTASAGEHMALALKRTHRAVLIGETTAGAGHFGSMERLPGGFSVFLPVGRTYDPDTGLDWEGRGVSPDIAVPADQALETALVRIG
jgi:hypothetical protein